MLKQRYYAIDLFDVFSEVPSARMDRVLTG
jgi:hypothetical protein